MHIIRKTLKNLYNTDMSQKKKKQDSSQGRDSKKYISRKPPVRRSKGKKPKKPNIWNQLVIAIVIFTGISLIYSSISESQQENNFVALSQLATDVSAGRVAEITVQGEKLEVIYRNEKEENPAENENEPVPADLQKESKKEAGTALSATLSNYGVTAEELKTVKIEIKSPTGFGYWALNILPFLIPIFFIIFILYYLSRQMKGAGAQAFTFGQSKARILDPSNKKQRITFKDVAGAKEAKNELEEIVDFLKNPKKFLDIGASIPKGILLMGAPGTGKTLLARAVAGEAGVAFFSISGSEFIEMFVGVGASRVRDLFKMAKQMSPAIIFIDEIDAVGRTRGSGMGGGNDEREQTLNQILVEMDGFDPTDKVIVMAATNRPDVLDPAILRPGRFDRRVTVDLPDRKDRLEIMKVHARKKPLAEDIAFDVIAARTPGFSGADLYSLMNEAAILAAREGRKTIGQFDLIRSIEKVMLGPERKSHIFSKKEKKLTAYHEAGHALVASVLPNADPVHKISIISRGNAGGYTLKLPDEDRRLHTRNQFLDDIAMSLGGYVTEEIVFGDVSTGPSNDLQVSTGLARHMVTRYGMTDLFGPIALEGDGGKTLFGGGGVNDKEYSPEVGNKIDAEVQQIMTQAYDRAKEIITKHRGVLDAIATKLIEVENLERPEYEELLRDHGIEVVSKEVDEKKKGE